MPDNGISLLSFLESIASGFLDVLRKNRLAATLSAVALVGTTILAFNSRYDERPRYRQVLLPDIEQADSRFLETMNAAVNATNEDWRLYYFVASHQKARDVLKVLKLRWPHTPDGIRAHEELIRYYETVSEELAIIRTEMSARADMDYIGAWQKRQSQIWPMHEAWASWVRGPGSQR